MDIYCYSGCITPAQVVAVIAPIAASAVVAFAGFTLVRHITEQRFLQIVVTVLAAALVYLLFAPGSAALIYVVTSWWEWIGI